MPYTQDPDVPPKGAPMTGSMTGEAGQLENRLSLNPGDKRWASTIDGWDDGKKYTVKAVVQQVSPGELEVLSIEEMPQADDESAETDEAPADDESESPDTQPENKAVAGLMD